jgi:hypothetical protein
MDRVPKGDFCGTLRSNVGRLGRLELIHVGVPRVAQFVDDELDTILAATLVINV